MSAAASVEIPCSTFHYLRVECLLVCPRRARPLPFLRRRPQSSQSFSSPPRKSRLLRLEHNDFSAPFGQFDKSPLEGVRVFGCLAAERVRLVLVLERDSEYATLARVEDMRLAAHILHSQERHRVVCQ